MLAPVIIYEDNHLLIVQKPPGFLSQPDGGAGPDLLAWAGGYLARDKPGRAYVGLVHRLDLSVGGVLALAKTSKAAARLSAQFRERRVEKIYLALVGGRVEAGAGRLEDSLVRDGSLTRAARTGEKGKDCVLSWRRRGLAESPAGPLTLLEINLLTGFKHQIRAQLARRGWPVAGDVKYQSPLGGQGPAIGLWAWRLTVEHPTKKEKLSFTAAPPPLWPWTLYPADRPGGLNDLE